MTRYLLAVNFQGGVVETPMALRVPSDFEDLLRELVPQVLGTLVRRYGDFDTAEDLVQEALFAAAVHWPHDGVPAKPRGWLIQTAERRFIDQRRSAQSRRRRESLALQQAPTMTASPTGMTR